MQAAVPAAALLWLAVRGQPALALAFGVVLGIVVLSVLLPAARARRRAGALRRWSDAHGWRAGGGTVAFAHATDMLHGTVRGVAITSCTTQFAPDWRRGLDTSRFRHLVAAAVAADFPLLTVEPRGGAQRPPAAGLDDVPDVDVEWAAFNDRWRVRCSEPRFAHGFCHPRLMERLMRRDAEGSVCS